MVFCGYQIGSRQVSSRPYLHPVHSWQSQNWLQRLEHSSKSTAFITHPPFPLSSLGPTRSFTALRSSLLNDRLGFDPENYPRHHIFYKTRQSHCFPSSAEPASLSLYLFKYKNSIVLLVLVRRRCDLEEVDCIKEGGSRLELVCVLSL